MKSVFTKNRQDLYSLYKSQKLEVFQNVKNTQSTIS